MYPTRSTICTAFTTIFCKSNAKYIEKIYNNDPYQWTQILEEFYEYYVIWKKHGILSMIQKIIFRHKVPEILLTIHTGKNSLINILHLGELLNNISQKMHNEYELIQWLESKITNSHNQHELSDYALRFNYDYNSIKISTIHKSKGLEFPITILPFLASFKYNKKILFHNQESFTSSYINQSKSPLEEPSLDIKCLSEDLRLLYVAITRSIYHCSIGIAPIIHKSRSIISQNTITDLHRSALGYLIQNKTPSTSQELMQYLKILHKKSNGDISFRLISNKQNISSDSTKTLINSNLSYKKWDSLQYHYNNHWRITSYSELINNYTNSIQLDLHELFNINLNHNFLESEEHILTSQTVHNFPKGKIYGTFFHNLFKTIDFKKPINTRWIKKQMILYNINLKWASTLNQWIYTIFNTPLNKFNLTLSRINFNNKQTEFKFHLNISANVTAQELNCLRKYYDPLSSKSSKLIFSKITGMLTGFIDLIFYWNHKYYLLDYKTNWLGENNTFYIQSNIEQEIIKHHYDLQYQLYTLALHRFLQHRIISYDYEKNFGGIYYLFIRGMDGISYKNGIYFCRPSWEFIKKLDNLFLKK